MIPPKPTARAERVSLLTYLRLFRADILSAQPARLYRAWMAEFRTPFFHSFLVNDPALVTKVLIDDPDETQAQRVADRTGGVAYASLAGALANRDFDAAIIAVPHHLHEA